MSWFKALAALVLALQVAACGFQPLYARRDASNVQASFTEVHIDAIEDRVGQQLRNHLVKLLHPRGRADTPRWRLAIKVTEGRRSVAVLKSAFATRAVLTFSAAVQLFRVDDGGAAQAFTSTVSASFNIFSSEFATQMAERGARQKAIVDIGQDIRVRVGAFLNDPERRLNLKKSTDG